MAEHLERIARLSEPDLDKFRRCVQTLLTEAFIVRSYRRHEPLYKFAVANFTLLETYFAFAGYRLLKDETLGVIAWEGSAAARFDLNLEETLALLILRLLYEEKGREVTLHGERTVLQQEFVEKYRVMTERTLKKTPLIVLLRRFQSLRLIEVLGDESDPETRIILYPSIAFALTGYAIDTVHEKIQSFKKGGEEEDVANA